MRNKWSLVILLLVLLWTMNITLAQSDTRLNVTEYQLDNGLEVILVEDHSAPTVAVNIWYKVGGANDPDGRSGFAHLFEHMMFQGSAHVGKGEMDRLIVAAGGDSPNAYTDIEHTAYYQVVPSHQLPLALWLEADRMASLAVTQTNLDNQRAVVIEEYQLRVGNAPYGEAVEELFTMPYDYAPYKKRVIGSVEDLNQATVQEVRDFHSTYYVTSNAVLVVAGDIDVDKTRALIGEYFGAIPGQPKPPDLPAYEPTQQDEAQIVTMEDPLINVPAVLIGYTAPPRSHPDYPAVELLSRILGVGDSSRLAQALIDTGQALAADTVVFSNRGPSLLGVILVPNMGVKPGDIEQVYYDELEKIRTDGVDADELEKAINGILSERIVSLETVLDLSESVQEANFYFDDPQAVFGELERFRQVTSADIQRVVGDYLASEDRHVITVVPGGEAKTDTPEPVVGGTGSADDDTAPSGFVLEQAAPPEPLPVNEFVLPKITEGMLDNGLQVIVIERPELPVISLDVFLPGGGSAVPADKAGLPSLTAGLLTRGTATRSAQDIASTIEQVGGSIGANAGDDSLSVGIFALREDTDLAFELLADVVLNSTFPENELEIYRANMLTDLQFVFSDPAALAGRTFNRLVYGEHPYGHTVTETSINGLTRDDVVNYYESQLNPDGALLIVAGDITYDAAMELAKNAFGGWESKGARTPVEYAEPPVSTGPKIYLVDRPGSTQVDLRIGHLGMRGDDPERYAVQVMNEVFGGGFTSRLSRIVREEKGYTYFIYSSFDAPVDQGTFVIQTAVRNEVIAEALQAILDQIKTLRTEDVPQAELDDVRSGMIGRFALALETYQAFVEQIASLKLRGLPIDALSDYLASVEQVDQAAVLKAANTYIDPDRLIIVAVGDASAVESKLAEIGPVEIVEAE